MACIVRVSSGDTDVPRPERNETPSVVVLHQRTKGQAVNGRPSALAAIAVTSIIGTTLTGFAPLGAEQNGASATVAAIEAVAPEALAHAEEPGAGTNEAAAVFQADGVATTVPVDASDGVTTGSGEGLLRIGLPYAQLASDAERSPLPGVVVYDNHNGSSTVPVIGDEGEVRIHTVIESPSAPHTYTYPLELPGGVSLTLNGDGSVGVTSTDGSFGAQIAAPWAKDANGNAVPTRYEVNGSTLTQIVDFDSATAFPVVADPSVITTTYTYSRADVERMWSTYQAMGAICNLVPGLNYMASLLCPGGARLQDAVNSAHYQQKRLKATFYNCGFTYCNYYEYKVVS